MRVSIRFAAFFLLIFSGFSSFAQVTTTARLDGSVTDPQGAAVPAAQVVVVQAATSQTFRTKTDDKGYWILSSLQTGVYKVTVTHEGFKAATNESVALDAGVPATVNMTLTIGAVTETVEVTAGAEVLQANTATVNSTLQGMQIHDLPFTSHNATELIATQPGTQTALAVRNSTINGLPQTTINITLDGVNIQDNATRSNPDAVFNAVQPRTEAIEEMTITTSAAGAESLGEGAVQIKFVTKSGSNAFHGGLFETNRNAAFEAKYYFNGLSNIATDRLNLNEFGGSVGGPVKKNKLFFFESFEAFRIPQSFSSTGTWINPLAAAGVFTYKDGTTGSVRTVNLFALAAAANPGLPAGTRAFPTAPDTQLAKTYALINQLTSSGGTIADRIATNNDYNRYNFTWGPKAVNNRNFQTTRIDYNLTDKHHINFVWNYQTNLRKPDGLNGTLAILPGTGSILGSNDLDGQFGIFFTGAFGVRSVISSHITNELTAGLQGGRATLGCCMSPTDYDLWKGNIADFRTNSGNYMSAPYTGNYTGFAPRTTPVKNLIDTVSYQRGNHLVNFGFNFTQVSAWQAAANSSLLHTIALGQATGDPDNTGVTSLFTTANFPNASSTQLSDAANLYGLIAGRVTGVTSSAVLGETTHTYGPNFSIDRTHQREFAGFVQDSWRVTPSLTINFGVRLDHQNPIVNLDQLYTRPGFAGLFGVSGVGHLFQPGTLTGTAPVFTPVKEGETGYDPGTVKASPTFGFAYRLPKSGMLHMLSGNGNAVLRGGFAIATNRQGIGFLDGVWNGNQGRSLSTSTSPGTTPAIFPAGGILFSDASFPIQAPTTLVPSFPNPAFPLAVQPGQNVSDFNPQLKPEYVESWNLGFQRELDKNTVVEFRYVGNHGVDLWRTVNLNEVNVFENGFLKEFQNAQNNLAIANGTTVAGLAALSSIKVTNFGSTGLPGQVAVPILQAALGTTTDTTTATQLAQGQVGATANGIAGNATRMSNLTKAGSPINYFQVNPTTGGNSNMLTNGSSSTYNSGQVEVRRRLSHGLQVLGSYVWSKSLTNANNPTLRNIGGEKGPTAFDIRHGIKATWVYQLPFGRGRQFLSGAHGVLGKVVEGWETAGVGRLQSGTPINFTSGRATFNSGEPGVLLHNITASQLQSEMNLVHTSQINSSGTVTGTVYYLPTALVNNTLAAFNNGGTLDPNAPYIGPCNTAGQLCDRIFLYGPWLSKWDVSMVKRTQIKERVNVEFRAQALNVLNHPNILLPNGGGGVGANGTGFGQTTTSFRDFNNTNDPGSRTLEFVLRLNF